MDYSYYEKLIIKNKQEIEALRRKETKTALDEEKIAYLEDLNKKIERFIETCKNKDEKINEIKDKISDIEKDSEISMTDKKTQIKAKQAEIKKIKKEKKELSTELSRTSRGRVHDILSSSIGNVDKRIHNWWYEGEKHNKRWSNHCDIVNERYTRKGLLKYTSKRFLGIAIAIGSSFILPVFGGMVFTGAIAYGAFTAVKTIFTIINKAKYGEPRLERKYDIQKGSWLENIKASVYKLGKQRSVTRKNGRVAQISVRYPTVNH